MKRRDFIKQTALTAAGVIAAPYILPGGRLFAKTGTRLANHVVVCLFAGGLRQLESVEKAEGNLMPHLLNGNENLSSDLLPFFDDVPAFTGKALQNFGTLYKEYRYNDRYTQHFNAHATAVSGVYASKVLLNQPLPVPSMFEYYRKHAPSTRSSLNAFWVCDKVGPFLYLNYSQFKGYGPQYGAHTIQPNSFFNGYHIRQNDFHIHEGAGSVQSFLNQQFNTPAKQELPSIARTEEEKERLSTFLYRMKQDYTVDKLRNFWNVGNNTNNDMLNIYTAINVLNEFEPELLMVNMQDIDAGHGSFVGYCNNLRKADYAAHKLWQAIQNNPRLKDDTVMILVPEHGRNLESNTMRDPAGRFANDHTGDEMSRRMFCMVLGPKHIVKQGQVIHEEAGEAIDLVPTVGHILGFWDDVPDKPKEFLKGRFLQEAFV